MTKTSKTREQKFSKRHDNDSLECANGIDQMAQSGTSLGQLLSIIWGSVLVVALTIYVLHTLHYPSDVTLLPKVISVPTLILAVTYLAKETKLFLKKRKEGHDGATPDDKSASTLQNLPANEFTDFREDEGFSELLKPAVGQKLHPKVQPVGLCITIVLVTLYIGLLSLLGFVVDSIIFIAVVPILLGQPVRKIALLLFVGSLLVVILGILVQLSGVIPLPVGILGIRIPSI